MAELSTKPYLIRAIHQWCEDSGYRPYLAVMVDERTQVPREFVRNGEIVLNVSAVATNRLQLGNDLIEFEARFSGSVRQVSIPIENVSAIYAQETGHGMAFDVPKPLALAPERGAPEPGAANKAAPVVGSSSTRPASRPKLVPRPTQPPADTAEPSAHAGAPGAASSTGTDTAPAAPARAAPTLAVSEPATAAPPLSSPVAGSAPVLQAVDSALPPGRTPRSAAPKARRRGKLSAVPDGAPAGSDISLRPVDAATEPSQAPAAPLPAGAETTPAGGPNASSSTGSAPDEPPPSPPVRPQLKRIK
jgi:stringent starvation protein B